MNSTLSVMTGTNAARSLSPALLLQVADFAEFLAKKRAAADAPADEADEVPIAKGEPDDDEVDLGGSGRDDESHVMDLSGILSNGPHSSIGLV